MAGNPYHQGVDETRIFHHCLEREGIRGGEQGLAVVEDCKLGEYEQERG